MSSQLSKSQIEETVVARDWMEPRSESGAHWRTTETTTPGERTSDGAAFKTFFSDSYLLFKGFMLFCFNKDPPR